MTEKSNVLQIHRCGMDWVYCNGQCSNCDYWAKCTTTTTGTNVPQQPTVPSMPETAKKGLGMRMSKLSDVEYIVTEEKILNAVRYGLEFIISDDTIVRKFMRPIEKQIGDMLDDECKMWRGEEDE